MGLRGVSGADRDWRETLLEPQRALIGLGFDGAVAAAGGPVYRGPSEHGSTIVHGGAVNRAAKLCAAEPPGGLGVDASLLGASGPTSPVLDRVIGRREESGQGGGAWLASGAPRMAILSGEAGIAQEPPAAGQARRQRGHDARFRRRRPRPHARSPGRLV